MKKIFFFCFFFLGVILLYVNANFNAHSVKRYVEEVDGETKQEQNQIKRLADAKDDDNKDDDNKDDDNKDDDNKDDNIKDDNKDDDNKDDTKNKVNNNKKGNKVNKVQNHKINESNIKTPAFPKGIKNEEPTKEDNIAKYWMYIFTICLVASVIIITYNSIKCYMKNPIVQTPTETAEYSTELQKVSAVDDDIVELNPI